MKKIEAIIRKSKYFKETLTKDGLLFNKINISILIILLSTGGILAQESINTAGGDAAGAGGSMSLSIGQTFVDFQSNGNSVSQGVQQPIELLSLGLKDDLILIASAKVFPNPTANKIQLKLELEAIDNLFYHIYDIKGKLLQSKEILEFTTEVQLSQLPTSVYFLKIIRNNNFLKTFKILKN